MDNNFSNMPNNSQNNGNVQQQPEVAQVPPQAQYEMPPTMKTQETPMSPVPEIPRHHALGKILLVLIVLAIIVIGAGYALGYINIPFVSGLNTNKLFTTMVEKQDFSNGQIKFKLSVKDLAITDDLEGERISFGLDPKSPQGMQLKSQFSQISGGGIDVEADYSFNDSNEDFTAELGLKGNMTIGAVSMVLDLAIKSTTDNIYFKVNKSPLPLIMGMTPDFLREGVWYSLPKEITQSEEFKKFKENLNDRTNTEEMKRIRKEVAAAIDNTKLFTISSLGKEDVDGESLSKYSLKLNRSNLQPFILAVFNIYKQSPNAPAITDEEIQNMEEKLNDLLTSPEADRVFDVINSNSSSVVYVKSDGTPILVKGSINIIPDSDSEEILSNSYINISTELKYEKMVGVAPITAPANFEVFDVSKIAPLMFGASMNAGSGKVR
jgi:hypothetical protein